MSTAKSERIRYFARRIRTRKDIIERGIPSLLLIIKRIIGVLQSEGYK